MSKGFDYDLVILGAGVGGHGAALHAVSCGLKTAIIEAADMGGTCVNRGCIPSKALLAASGRVRDLRNTHHLQSMGIQVAGVNFDQGAIASHANNLVGKLKSDLTNSLKRLGVDIIQGWGKVTRSQKVTVKVAGKNKSLPRKILLFPQAPFPLCPQVLKLMEKPFSPVMTR